MSAEANNMQPMLDEIEAGIREDLKRARRADAASLAAYTAIGEKLSRAGDVLAWKDLLVWAKTKFGFGRSWSARLLSLYRAREKVEKALAWAGDQTGTKLMRAKYTVDGALKLVGEHEKATAPRSAEGGEQAPRALRRETPKARLERELAAARRRIEQLEGTLRAHSLEPPPEGAEAAEPEHVGVPDGGALRAEDDGTSPGGAVPIAAAAAAEEPVLPAEPVAQAEPPEPANGAERTWKGSGGGPQRRAA
jgi:hypothetical protein